MYRSKIDMREYGAEFGALGKIIMVMVSFMMISMVFLSGMIILAISLLSLPVLAVKRWYERTRQVTEYSDARYKQEKMNAIDAEFKVLKK